MTDRPAYVKNAPYDLPQRVVRDILAYSEARGVEKVILFGSRARKDNGERSDIDIAVRGGDFDGFYFDIKEKAYTLLMFDIVDLDSGVSGELEKEISRDGIVIYEKA